MSRLVNLSDNESRLWLCGPFSPGRVFFFFFEHQDDVRNCEFEVFSYAAHREDADN